MTQFNQCAGSDSAILRATAKFLGNLGPDDIRMRDVVAVVALALSGFLPEILLLAVMPVAISDDDTARAVARTALLLGFGMAGYLLSRPATV